MTAEDSTTFGVAFELTVQAVHNGGVMRKDGRLDNGNTHIEVWVEFNRNGKGGQLFPQLDAEAGILQRIFGVPANPVLTVNGESFPIGFTGEPWKDNAATRRKGYGFQKLET
jgi:hypothetical protein